MIHTPKIEKAIHKASILHRKQVRKGEDELPYITHLFSVFTILAQYTKDEDILIAGLLHDTLEDTPYTGDELERDFGVRVRKIVEGITDKEEKDGKKITWIDKKKGYIEGLKISPEESLYVSAADKIHNFQSLINTYKDNAEALKQDFNMEDRILFYGVIVDLITERLGGNNALVQELQETFSKYKTFLEKAYN